ncbi:ESPR-type extended signal peptide-containing protein, partial [Roseateles sp.]|uniref:ESPR-type extended signal peptide-containing protein n=1 Tax=Roseateles sp. TaxID=1971397 RepID=UPI0037CA00BF
MNRIFRSVWSEVTRTYVAAAETVKRSNRSAGGSAVDAPALMPSGGPSAAQQGISRPRPMLLALEARLMFDGAAVETVASAAGAASMFDRPVDTVFVPAAIAAREAGASTTPLAAAKVLPAAVAEEALVTDGAARLEVMFVDPSVANYESLLAGARPGVEVVVLDASRDGLAQVAEYLKGRS